MSRPRQTWKETLAWAIYGSEVFGARTRVFKTQSGWAWGLADTQPRQ